ncbi:Fic family protein [bacterium]|nr:Fic family protein [bacterium]
MSENFDEIRLMLQKKAEYQARLNLLPYDGTPEVKEQSGSKYIYLRKRIGSRLTSTYVGAYSDDLYQLLLRNSKESKELKKLIRHTEKRLSELGYTDSEIPLRVQRNLDFARANLKANIYDQAVLEGVATSFPQTEEIIENGKVSGMTATDVQKILNLKHAWEFILDKDVVQSDTDYYLLCHIAKLVNEGFFFDAGRIRAIPVSIGGSSYIPPIPIESVVKERIAEILNSNQNDIDIAAELCLYSMKTQVFTDGNKRASVIFANHYLISHGQGLLVIPEKEVAQFKKLLVAFYEGEDIEIIKNFLKEHCWKKF